MSMCKIRMPTLATYEIQNPDIYIIIIPTYPDWQWYTGRTLTIDHWVAITSTGWME